MIYKSIVVENQDVETEVNNIISNNGFIECIIYAFGKQIITYGTSTQQ
jgi:hypothetical protein